MSTDMPASSVRATPSSAAAGAGAADGIGIGAVLPAVSVEAAAKMLASAKSDPYVALVKNPNDLLAALAYVAYKHHEIEFIEAITTAGDTVSDQQLRAFRISCCVDSQLEKYTARAEKLVNAFLAATLDKNRPR